MKETKTTVEETVNRITTTSVMDVMNKCLTDSMQLGMNLFYEPGTVVDDISTLTTEEWKAQRCQGIGGSDCSVIMGVNKWKSPVRLWLEKTGQAVAENVDWKKQFTFDCGHVMEPAIANAFSAMTDFKVGSDNRMLRHPSYPWMIGDLDGICFDQSGQKCGLEFKTTSPDNKRYWVGGILGQGAVCPKPEYICQVRHYMSVANIYRYYLICSFSNNAEDLCVIRIDRDMKEEKRLIEAEAQFWNQYVITGIRPPVTTLRADEFKDVIMPSLVDEKLSSTPVSLSSNGKSSLEELLKLTDEKKLLDEKAKKVEERMSALQMQILEELKTCSSSIGYVELPNGEKAVAKIEESNGRSSVDTKKLKSVYPEVYSDVYKPGKSSKKLKTWKQVKEL